MLYAGLDIGSCTTKAVVINDNCEIIGKHVVRSGVDYRSAANEVLYRALNGEKIENVPIVATGYGRYTIPNVKYTKTEIACHAKGGYYYVKRAMTLVDIGGQDNKVIKLDDAGYRIDFRMNRKCAAGTGTFIEEIANRMAIPLDALNEMALKSKNIIKIGSYCTVFASTEVLSHIRAGVKAEDLVRGVFESVVDRVMEMIPLADPLVLCGGVVEYFPVVIDIFKSRIHGEVIVPPYPQLTGAFGAALFARQEAG